MQLIVDDKHDYWQVTGTLYLFNSTMHVTKQFLNALDGTKQ